MTRYLKITQTNGARFILRVTSESPDLIVGIEVDAEGDEVVPRGTDPVTGRQWHQRVRVVPRATVKKAVEMRMNPTYATLEVAPHGEGKSSARLVNIITDTATLAEAMYPGGGLAAFNEGAYEGTTIPRRKMTGREVVTVAGTVAGAKVVTDETWIADRFGGEIGARQIRRLIQLAREAGR